MIGIILTGHGNFSSGLFSSLKLIAGKKQCIEVVDFLPTDSFDNLEENLRNAVNKLSKCEGIIFLTDLLGGSPFKASVLLSQSIKNSKVIYGTNLPLLIEIVMMLEIENNVNMIVNNVIKSVKEQIGYFEFNKATNNVNEGI